MKGKEKSGKKVTIDYEAFAALVGLCKAACEAGLKLMAGTFTGNRELVSRTLCAGDALAGSVIDSGAVARDDAIEYASAAACCRSVRCEQVMKEGE